jgi:hypothetical protein
MCSIGSQRNENAFDVHMFGFKTSCQDCSCVPALPGTHLPRDQNVLWIIGTHHKMGSHLNRDIWQNISSLVMPPLSLYLSQIWPMTDHDWKAHGHSKDMIITFHAQNITAFYLQQFVNRPYRFVHFVRDPIAAVVSGYLYETQRELRGDRYNAMVHKTKNEDEGLKVVLDYMMVHAFRPMVEQFQHSARDHNALNIKFEDTITSFNDTYLRIFHFLGVPQTLIPSFLASASSFDLQGPAKLVLAEKTSKHVTRDKYNTTLLYQKVQSDTEHSRELRAMRILLGYEDP